VIFSLCKLVTRGLRGLIRLRKNLFKEKEYLFNNNNEARKKT